MGFFNDFITDSLLACDVETARDLAGYWVFRWTDSTEWEPVNGEHGCETSARRAVRAEFGCLDQDFVCEEM